MGRGTRTHGGRECRTVRVVPEGAEGGRSEEKGRVRLNRRRSPLVQLEENLRTQAGVLNASDVRKF